MDRLTEKEYHQKLLNNELTWENVYDKCYYEFDNETVDYENYLKVFPDKLNEIMECFLPYICYDKEKGEKMINDFVNLGWDINELAKYPNDGHSNVTPLISVCEWRYYTTMELLLKNGANVNIYSEDNYNALSSVIVGHNIYYNQEPDECLKCIKLLEEYDLYYECQNKLEIMDSIDELKKHGLEELNEKLDRIVFV